MIYTALVGARMYQVMLDAVGTTHRMQEALATFLVEDLLLEEQTFTADTAT